MESTNTINIPAERAVLSAIMQDNSLLVELGLAGFDFYREAHRVIYSAMGTLMLKGFPVDMITLQQQLKDEGKLEAVGGLEYIMGLASEVFTTAGAKGHAKIISECALKRELIRYAQEAKILTESEDMDINQLVNDLQQKLKLIIEAGNESDDVVDVTTSLGKVAEELKAKAEAGEIGIPTGFYDYDKATGGLHGSDLIILAARPGMGKTAFAMNIARNLVYKEGKSVLFASLEMSTEQLQLRLISSMTGVETSKFRTPNMITDVEWRKIEAVKHYKAKGHLNVFDKSGCTPSEINRRARQVQLEHGLDLIIVDYLQLMHWDGKKTSDRVLEVSDISRQLKILAKELNVPIIALSQLNRGVEARQDKRPMLSDLRESGSIEQDADQVLFIYRDKYYNPESENPFSELLISKNRHGARVGIALGFKEETTTFMNVVRREQ